MDLCFQETAYNYFLKGCQGGYARACYNTAVLNDTPIAEERKWRASFQGKPELAKKFYKLACDIDNSAIIGCRKYGLSLFNSNPQRDPVRVELLYFTLQVVNAQFLSYRRQ